MEQTFIRIKKGEGFINKDIIYSTKKERLDYYDSLSKGQVASILEKFVENKLVEENCK